MNGQMDTIRKIVTVVVTLGAIASWLAMIGIFVIPIFYVVIQRISERKMPFRHEEVVRAGTRASAPETPSAVSDENE